MLKSYSKQDNVVLGWDFNVKFPLLHLIQFLSDLKSTIISCDNGHILRKMC